MQTMKMTDQIAVHENTGHLLRRNIQGGGGTIYQLMFIRSTRRRSISGLTRFDVTYSGGCLRQIIRDTKSLRTAVYSGIHHGRL